MSNNSNYIQATENVQQICNKPYLYKITNQINNKFYYGVHNGTNPNYMGSGKLLHLAYEKHGIENFKKEILMWFDTMEEAYEYEAIVVTEKLINDPMCYNMKVGGFGGTTPCEETKQKMSEAAIKKWEDMSPEEKEKINQKQSEAAIKNWDNKSEEEKEEFSQQRRGENNPMFGQNPYANKTEAEMAAISQKLSDSVKKAWANKPEEEMEEYIQKCRDNWANKPEEEKQKISQKFKGENNPMFGQGHRVAGEKNGMFGQGYKGENNPMFGQGHKIAGEKNGNKKMFQHPYNPNFKGNCNKISNDIRKNYPNEKQWNQLTIKERQSYKIVSPE